MSIVLPLMAVIPVFIYVASDPSNLAHISRVLYGTLPPPLMDAIDVGHWLMSSVGAVLGDLASIAALMLALFAARVVSSVAMLMTRSRC